MKVHSEMGLCFPHLKDFALHKATRHRTRSRQTTECASEQWSAPCHACGEGDWRDVSGI